MTANSQPRSQDRYTKETTVYVFSSSVTHLYQCQNWCSSLLNHLSPSHPILLPRLFLILSVPDSLPLWGPQLGTQIWLSYDTDHRIPRHSRLWVTCLQPVYITNYSNRIWYDTNHHAWCAFLNHPVLRMATAPCDMCYKDNIAFGTLRRNYAAVQDWVEV